MPIHVLNGDALAGAFSATALPGERIICRECLIEGPLDGDCPTAFWHTRARYLRDTYGETPGRYLDEVARPLSVLTQLPAGAEVNLWFEHDLFCQANLWLTLSLLADNPHPVGVYLVYPRPGRPGDLWRGFGALDAAGLERSFAGRYSLNAGELALGADLWAAYKARDLERLDVLSRTPTSAFPHLAAVVRAHIERFAPAGQTNRPERVLAGLISEYGADFARVFSAFSEREGIYGFGDSQVRRMFEKMI